MEKYKIFGSEMSPYSVKVRAYLRFKQIPHEWILRSKENRIEFDKLAQIPLIPLVVCPSGEVLQDSTLIIERLEQVFPSPSITPDDPVYHGRGMATFGNCCPGPGSCAGDC